MNILLKGYYGFGNFGDDLLMLISYRLIKEKYPSSNVTIFSNNTENLSGFKLKQGYNNYIFKILEKKVPLVDWTFKGHFDLVVEGGGGTYFDNQYGGMFYYLRNKVINIISYSTLKRVDFLLRNITGRKQRITYNKKIILGIGIGPYTNSAKLFYANLVDLASSDFIMVRDKISFNLIKKLRKRSLGSDLAFATNYWNDLFQQSHSSNTSQSVGFILMGNKTTFENKILGLALHLKKLGWNVHFFAFDEAVDKSFINECKKHFNINIWQPHSITLNEYILQLQKCSILFTERAHGAIVGAIIGCTPFYISSSYKTNQILSFFKNANYNNSMTCKKLDKDMLDSLYMNMGNKKELLKTDVELNRIIVTNSLKLAF